MSEWKVVRVGDRSVVLEFEQAITPAVNARAIAVAERIRLVAPKGVQDVVESYCAVTVHFDPLRTLVEAVINTLKKAAEREEPHKESGRKLRVPVCYGGMHGPDLGAVARFARCSDAEVIETHISRNYRVYMLGFLPGFAYMGSVNDRIAMPRRETPRLRVPMGSVGIAGRQTGIYPLEAPGGWQLIGRTPLRAFALDRREPFLFRPGDEVRFESVDDAAFTSLLGES